VLYFFLPPGRPLTGAVVTCGVACCLIGAANALRLPRRSAADAPERPASGLPTGAAARAIFGEPHVLVFCVAMFLVHAASQAYYQFYPLHLTDRAGIDKRFVGLIANVGVVVEIFFMLGFGRLVRRLTLRRVMYLGAGAIGLRMLLLAVFVHPIVAVGVQLLHGMTVLVVHVAPPIFLDARADDRYRNSIQGLYAMAFAGAGKVVGAWGAGRVAEHSLAWAFGGAGAICAVAVVLFYCAFHEGRGMRERNMKT
jgi:PPP family 3-phenylpropionic acid transporter